MTESHLSKKTAMKVLSASYRWYWPEGALFALSAGLYLYNPIRYVMPTGYAGLYTLMSELLVTNSFRLPQSVPFYGPGGFPYAYPPVGFYIAGIANYFLRIPLFTYLRFAPVLFTLLFLVLDYILIKKITCSRNKALIGAFLTACASAVYEYHVPAAGMVRSPALVFATLTLILCWEALSRQSLQRSTYVIAALSGVALGLTVMSHLSYALFAILGILVFAFAALTKGVGKAFITSGIIFGSGIVVSAPWWGTLIGRYGFQILVNPAQSHGNFGVFQALLASGVQLPVTLIKKILAIPNDWLPVVLAGLMVAGMIYLVLRRRWLLLAWFLLIFLIVGESKRYLVIVACMACGMMIGDLVDLVHEQEAKLKRGNVSMYAFSILLLFGFIFYGEFSVLQHDSPTLTKTLMDMSSWLKHNTAANASYLLLDASNDTDEWIPYLAQRTPITGQWGAEWTNNQARLEELTNKLTACINQQSFPCIKQVIEENNLATSCLVSVNSRTDLNAEITLDPAWHNVYQNDKYTIFEKR